MEEEKKEGIGRSSEKEGGKGLSRISHVLCALTLHTEQQNFPYLLPGEKGLIFEIIGSL